LLWFIRKLQKKHNIFSLNTFKKWRTEKLKRNEENQINRELEEEEGVERKRKPKQGIDVFYSL
jgi:hypothetical protein